MNIKERFYQIASVNMKNKCSPAELEDFAEALVAELAKENKPVGHVDYGDRVEWYGTKPVPETDLFTIPPTAEQVEQETAEACAKYLRDRAKPNLEAAQVMDDVVYAIRSGAWKEYL